MIKKEADAIAEIIKIVEEYPVDDIDKGMLLKSAASYFDNRAQSRAMREVLHKAVLQATMPKDMSIN